MVLPLSIYEAGVPAGVVFLPDHARARMMIESDARQFEGGQKDKRLSAEVEQEILRAIARIDYGSIEVVVHDGRVVQIECREKIRVVRDEPGRKGAMRQIRQQGIHPEP
jgi:hypothetical protein